MTILYILISLFFLSFIIFVHELFHLLAAKALKIEASEFAVGFGPSFLVYQKNEGKSVFKFFSKKDDKDINKEKMKYHIRTIPLGGYVSFASEKNGVTEDGLEKHKPWKRIIVAVAGPIGNFVFAIFLSYFLLIYTSQNAYTGEGIKLTNVLEHSLAEKMGLKKGDVLLEINDTKITKDMKFDEHFINGTEICFTVKDKENACGFFKENEKYIGIEFEGSKEAYNVITAIPKSFTITYEMSVEYTKAFINMLQNFKIKELSGPVGTIDVMQQTVPEFDRFVFVLIMVNIALGAANLLFPFSITDGGRIVIDSIAILLKKHSLQTKYLDILSVCLMILLMATTVVVDIQRILN